jgi:hypothetical protein
MKKLCAVVYFLFCGSLYANVVTDWATIIQSAIHHSSAPRPPASAEVLHAMVQLAMYDAAISIEGGYEPYAAAIPAPAGSDVRAAVATAAWRVARNQVAASQFPYLDSEYATYMAGIPDGQAKVDGIQVGDAAAASMIALRDNDGFNNTVLYQCSSNPPPPGEFEPNAGCGTQPVDAKLVQVAPFTYDDPSQFRPDGPDPLTSNAYTEDFN